MVKYLLDTSVILLSSLHPERLSVTAQEICAAPDAELVLSVASLWEITIKAQMRKLPIENPEGWLGAAIQKLRAEVLAIDADHVHTLNQLPAIHRDPFDRILVAQALSERLPFVTNDAVVRRYPIECLW